MSMNDELSKSRYSALALTWKFDPWGFRETPPGQRHHVQDQPLSYIYHIVDEIGEVQVEVSDAMHEIVDDLRISGMTWRQIAHSLDLDEFLPLRDRYRKQRRKQRIERIKRWIRGD